MQRKSGFVGDFSDFLGAYKMGFNFPGKFKQ